MAIVIPPTAVIEVQVGGAGATNWKTLAIITNDSHARMGPIDSGEAEVSRQYARDMRTGQLKPVAEWLSGDPETYTAELELNFVQARLLLEDLAGRNNIRVRYFTGDYGNPVNYSKILQLSGAWTLKKFGGFSTDHVNSFEGQQAPADPQRRTFPLEAGGYFELDPLAHSDLSGSVTALAINHIISVGYPRVAGQVEGEYANNPGNKEWIAGTSRAGAGGVPRVLYTLDKGATWTSFQATGLTDGDISGVALAGDNVVISMTNTGGGLAWAKWSEIKAGTATFTRSTNISAGTVVNMVVAVSNKILWACGDTGTIYKSTDGGITFVQMFSGTTANNLRRIAYATENLVWIGGVSGTLVRVLNDVATVVTVTGMGAVQINALAVPNMSPGRLDQLYVGSNGGDVYVCDNGGATTPVFSARYVGPSAISAIDGLAFAGPNGDVLYVVETNASTQSRVSIDLSGGRFGQDLLPIGTFTAPANATIDAIAAADPYTAMCVGPVETGQGFIGLISA